MRPVRIIAALLFAATAGLLTVSAAPAWARSTRAPVVQASPNPVTAGHSVTLSGSVDPDRAAAQCPRRHPVLQGVRPGRLG
jgi:Flp pilus assembly protein CpaB